VSRWLEHTFGSSAMRRAVARRRQRSVATRPLRSSVTALFVASRASCWTLKPHPTLTVRCSFDGQVFVDVNFLVLRSPVPPGAPFTVYEGKRPVAMGQVLPVTQIYWPAPLPTQAPLRGFAIESLKNVPVQVKGTGEFENETAAR
jgi:hypothetical protein